MATYKKPNITAKFITSTGAEGSGDAVSLEAFRSHKTIKAVDEISNKEMLIPFHAVTMATISVTSTDETKADPYCK